MSADSSLSIRVDRVELQSLVENFDLPVLQASPPCYLFDARAQDGDFLGRTDILSRLDAALLPGLSKPARHVALFGSPGLGKTETAREFVLSRKEKFDAIFWIHADSDAKIKQGRYSVLKAEV